MNDRDEPAADPGDRGSAAAASAAPARPTAAVARRRSRRWPVIGGAVAVLAVAATVGLAAQGGWYEPQLVAVAGADDAASAPPPAPAASPPPPASPANASPSTALTAVVLAGSAAGGPPAVLPAVFSDLAPRGVYLTVDTYANRLRVYRSGTLLREAICSTGSGIVLKDPVGDRTWVFDTPLGERRVQRKVRNPVWIKPDWAFVEQGFLPPKDFRQRVDDVSLGDYGLYLGDGYIIHGTLFQTLLGRPLTHGCIRLGDEDLEYVYRNTPVGARVFLY